MEPLIELSEPARARIKAKEAELEKQRYLAHRAIENDLEVTHQNFGGYYTLFKDLLRDEAAKADSNFNVVDVISAHWLFVTHAEEYRQAIPTPGDLAPVLAELREKVIKKYGEQSRTSIESLESQQMGRALDGLCNCGNPYLPSNSRHEVWLTFCKDATRSLYSAAKNQSFANEQIANTLRPVISASPDKRDELWPSAVTTLRSIQPRIDWPDAVPADINEVIQLLLQATAVDEKDAILRRLGNLAGNAMSKFLVSSEDIDSINQIFQRLQEFALAILGKDTPEIVRVTIEKQRWQWEDTARKWVEQASLPPRRWNIFSRHQSIAPHKLEMQRKRFGQIASHAVEVELTKTFDHPFEAADAWLDILQRERAYDKGPWIVDLCITSAEYCIELKIRALKAGNSVKADLFSEIEKQFGDLAASGADLYASSRGIEHSKSEAEVTIRVDHPVEPSGQKATPSQSTRGRRRKFSQQQLDQAQQMKLAGKTNNEIARVLYGDSPTEAHRRSVPTILKHHFGSKKAIEK
jgi:hypothetical protein